MPDEILLLTDSWVRHLQSRHLSPRTISSYCEATGALAQYLPGTKVAAVSRADLERFIGSLLATRSASTAANRYRSLKQFFKWLAEEDEIDKDPMATMKPPRVSDNPPDVLSPKQLVALFDQCKGRSFGDRRDSAILSVLSDNGARVSEIVGMRLIDVNLSNGYITVTGKGDKQRDVPLGAQTVLILDRYLRARQRHELASLAALWLGKRGMPLTVSGVAQMLRRRGSAIGLPGLHPHQFRHTFSHEWLSAGGSEGDLMEIAGWSSREMVRQYGRSVAGSRARESHKKISLVDRLGS